MSIIHDLAGKNVVVYPHSLEVKMSDEHSKTDYTVNGVVTRQAFDKDKNKYQFAKHYLRTLNRILPDDCSKDCKNLLRVTNFHLVWDGDTPYYLFDVSNANNWKKFCPDKYREKIKVFEEVKKYVEIVEVNKLIKGGNDDEQ